MRENAAAAAMLTPVTKPNIALAKTVATASRPGSHLLTRFTKREQVPRRAAFRQELAHQHEQRDDGEDVVAQRLVGRVGDEARTTSMSPGIR